MKRRDLFKSALAGAGAASAAAAQEASQHAAHSGTVSASNSALKSASGTAAWTPVLFDAHQNETVVVLSELIIPRTDTPGAKDAKVNEYIDFILSESAADRRARFIQGLGWLDGYAIRQHGAPFVGLKEADQVAVLRTLSSARDQEELRPGAEFFRQIKQLTVQGYYTSKPGIEELNKGGRAPAKLGCEHGGRH